MLSPSEVLRVVKSSPSESIENNLSFVSSNEVTSDTDESLIL